MRRNQTSTLISPRAFAALAEISRTWSMSRDATARRLLDDYLEAQIAAADGDRLVHISTVVRYPYAFLSPGERRTVRLPLRLNPGVDDKVVDLSFRFPGQASRQAHADYAARPLADALSTAIAMQAPFVDPGLEGLPLLLTHREAEGLWRLVAASTRTVAERRALEVGGASDRVQEELRDGAAAWHSPWRFRLGLHFARRLLDRDEETREKHLAVLGGQGEMFRFHEKDLEGITVFGGHSLTEGAADKANSHEGRGATAVWRARRRESVDGIAEWLTSGNSGTRFVDPPGWRLRMPEDWTSARFRRGTEVPSDFQKHLTQGRVLRIDHDGRSCLWPLSTTGAPIAGFEAVIAGGRHIEPVRLAESVLLDQRDLAGFIVERSLSPLAGHLQVPAQVAYDLDLIDEAEHDHIVSEASARLEAEMTSTLAAAAGRHHRLGPSDLADLRAATHDPRSFQRLAATHHLRFHLIEPTWRWKIETLVDLLATATDAQLGWWGSAWPRTVGRVANDDMQLEWFMAFAAARSGDAS